MKNKRVLSKTIALKTAVETEGLQLLWQIKFPKILGRSFCKKHFRYKTKKQRQNTAEGAQHKRQRKGKTILHVQLRTALLVEHFALQLQNVSLAVDARRFAWFFQPRV